VVGRKISLKYEGRCLKCGRMIPTGAEAYWESGKGVWHLACRSPETTSPRRLSTKVMVLVVVLVVSALVLGYSAGNIGRYWSPQTPLVTRTIETVTVTASASTTLETVSTRFETTATSSLLKWIVRISSDPPVISYLDAGKYIGQTRTVEGTIVRTYRYEKGNVIFLDFHDPYQGYFEVIIWRENWKNFPFAPEVFYKGKEVRVTGLIKDYKGSPQMELTSPRQIEVAYMGFNYPAGTSASLMKPEVMLLSVAPFSRVLVSC